MSSPSKLYSVFKRIADAPGGVNAFIKELGKDASPIGHFVSDFGDNLRKEHRVPDYLGDYETHAREHPSLEAMREYTRNSQSINDLFRFPMLYERWKKNFTRAHLPEKELQRIFRETEDIPADVPLTKKEMLTRLSYDIGRTPTSLGKRAKFARQLIKEFVPAQRDMVLFRGLGTASRTRDELQEMIAEDPTGTIYGNRGFLGTTPSPGVAASFAHDPDNLMDPANPGKFMILVPEGAPILPLGRNSAFHTEGEVLLPPMSWLESLEGAKPFKSELEEEYLPLVWRGRGKGPSNPDKTRWIGGALPLSLLEEYDDEQ